MSNITTSVLGGGPIWSVTNTVFPSNCYIFATEVPGDCLIIDPGLDSAPIEKALFELDLVPRAILCTHGHFDHVGTAAYFQDRYDCPVYMHERDLKTLRSSNFLLMAFKIPARIRMPSLHNITDLNPLVRIGGLTVRFHPVPGHTPGSCVIEILGSLFTGDTLYARGVGLSKLPGEDAVQIRASILFFWNRFADDMMVRPGHGKPALLGWIKKNNTELLDFLNIEP